VEGEVQKLTDRFVKSIDDHLKHKEAEVMKVVIFLYSSSDLRSLLSSQTS
jgi:hypothetical protein